MNELTKINEFHYDTKHHPHVGDMFANCNECGQSLDADIHTSFEEFSQQCDIFNWFMG